MTTLIFDSGIGGLSILREVRTTLPNQNIVYIGDDAGFPYGDWQEAELIERIEHLFDIFIERYQPQIAIVACNTASTLILPSLRNRFDINFVGTVPAIKPAAERTYSGMISVLGTPGTIDRPYTRDLINKFAADVDVNLVASSGLARMAESYMLGQAVNPDALLDEIQPCFKQSAGLKTDIVVLGCTHYPFLANEMRKIAPWPVDWLDPAEAIAQRAQALFPPPAPPNDLAQRDIAVMTSGTVDDGKRRLLQGFGLQVIN